MQVRSTAPIGENDVVVNNRKFEIARYSHDKYLTQNAKNAPRRTKPENTIEITMHIPKRYQNPAVDFMIDWTKLPSASVSKPNNKTGRNLRTKKRTMMTFIQKSTRSPRFVLSCIDPPCKNIIYV